MITLAYASSVLNDLPRVCSWCRVATMSYEGCLRALFVPFIVVSVLVVALPLLILLLLPRKQS